MGPGTGIKGTQEVRVFSQIDSCIRNQSVSTKAKE